MTDFAYRLKQLRTTRKITQSGLANAMNVSQNAVFNWENGKREPSMDMIAKIADYFEVSVEYLMTGEEPHYYLNEETAKMAQQIFEDKELRMLFDAARDVKPEDLKLVHDMMLALKRKEEGSSDEGC